MNQTITSECVTLSDEVYQEYTDKVQSVINQSEHQAWCREEIELYREKFEICPETKTLTILVLNAQDKPLVEFSVPENEYKIKHPLKSCQDCGIYQSIEAMNERLGNPLPYCPKGCHECRVRFESLRQQLKRESYQVKKMKPRYYRRVS